MVLERYRTMGAVLALGEFTVSELARLSGVREPTVRTVLRRERDLVEQIGTRKVGRRGGQPGHWRLRPEARERLRAQLQELERLGVGPWLGEREDDSHVLPAGLTAAEDVLLRLAPLASNPADRAELVELAQAQLDAVNASALPTREVASDVYGRRISAHRRVVEQLLELERTERTERPGNWSHVEGVWNALQLSAEEIKDEPLAKAVRSRLMQSPLRPTQPMQSPLRPTQPPSFGRSRGLYGHVGGPDPRMVSEMRRLQQRVKDLEAELTRLQEENDVLAAEVGEELLVPAREATRTAELAASDILAVAGRVEELLFASEAT